MPRPITATAIVSTAPTTHSVTGIRTFDVTLLPLSTPPVTLTVRAGAGEPIRLGDRWRVTFAPDVRDRG